MTLPTNEIIPGDCIEVMKTFPDRSVDLVFADPPYNMQLQDDLIRPDGTRVDAVNDAWDSFASFAAYDKFTNAWLTEAKRVLKDTGTLWVMGSYHNIHRVGTVLQNLSYWILNDIVWIKANPTPQMKGTRFCNAHEYLIWAAKSPTSRKYTFHYKDLKAANEDKQMRSDWYIPICSGGERLKDEQGNKAHSTQKPEALLYRVLTATTNPGDIVLDPFSGSGTTAAVAKKLGRNYIGIEMDANYVEMSRQRIAEAVPYTETEKGTLIGSSKPRIPFAYFVESGLLAPGAKLHLYASPKQPKDIWATVNADATITVGGVAGSIHQVGKTLLELPSCNGWMHWHYFDEKAGMELPLDNLRNLVIAGVN
jgi:modification methylase